MYFYNLYNSILLIFLLKCVFKLIIEAEDKHSEANITLLKTPALFIFYFVTQTLSITIKSLLRARNKTSLKTVFPRVTAQ